MSDNKNQAPVTREEFQALENAVNSVVEAVAKVAVPVSSFAMQDGEKVEKPSAPKAFELKGVGKVKLKFPSFKIGKDVIKAADIEKDEKAAQELYKNHPQLFVNLSKK